MTGGVNCGVDAVQRSQPLRSKWLKTKMLLNNSAIKPFIPDTQRYSQSNLKTMLEKYRMVYVKPEIGTFGMGVIKAEMHNQHHFAYQIGQKRLTFNSFESFYRSLTHRIKQKAISFNEVSICCNIITGALTFG